MGPFTSCRAFIRIGLRPGRLSHFRDRTRVSPEGAETELLEVVLVAHEEHQDKSVDAGRLLVAQCFTGQHTIPKTREFLVLGDQSEPPESIGISGCVLGQVR